MSKILTGPKKWIVNVIIGTFLMALATNLFYSPADMVPGGFTGLAMVIREITKRVIPDGYLFSEGIPVGFTTLALNIPLILAVIKIRGWGFMKHTFFAAILLSVFLLCIPEIPLVTDDLFLTSVLGGTIEGLGLGFVFLGYATTGGTDSLAALIQTLIPQVSTAKIMPVLDGMIILLAVWIFGIKITLYAAVSVFLQGRVADSITSGIRNAKTAFVVSDHYKEISERVLQEMSRGVTLLEATGMYTGDHKPVLMVAVSSREIVILREVIAEIDNSAFLIILDATEIRGKGFLRYTSDEL